MFQHLELYLMNGWKNSELDWDLILVLAGLQAHMLLSEILLHA